MLLKYLHFNHGHSTVPLDFVFLLVRIPGLSRFKFSGFLRISATRSRDKVKLSCYFSCLIGRRVSFISHAVVIPRRLGYSILFCETSAPAERKIDFRVGESLNWACSSFVPSCLLNYVITTGLFHSQTLVIHIPNVQITHQEKNSVRSLLRSNSRSK
jgi:hypothetical protein